jgi:mannosyltransferase
MLQSFLKITIKYIKTSYDTFWFHLLVFALSILFFAFNCTASPLWADECFSVFHSQYNYNTIIDIGKWDIPPPFYQLTLGTWIKFFGVSEFSVRFMSVLFMAGASALVYKFAVNYFNLKTALVALLFFFSCYDIFNYAHEVRCYALLLFLVTASQWAFFELLFKPKYYLILLLGLLNFLLFYTHYLTVFLFPIQGLVAILYFNKKSLLFYFLTYVPFLGLLWHWLDRLFQMFEAGNAVGWLGTPTVSDFAQYWVELTKGKYVFLLFFGLFVVGIYQYFRENRVTRNDKTVVLLYHFLLGVGVVFLSFVVSQFSVKMFLDRYLLFTVPSFYLLAAFLISQLKIKKSIFLGLLLIIAGVSFIQFDWQTKKFLDLKEMTDYLKTKKDAQTITLVQIPDIHTTFSYYYNRDFFENVDSVMIKLNDDNIYFGYKPQDFHFVNFDKKSKLILVQTFEDRVDPKQEMYAYFNANFKKIKTQNFKEARITEYENSADFQSVSGYDFKKKPLRQGQFSSIASIKTDVNWYAGVKERAKARKVSVDEQLYEESLSVINDFLRKNAPEPTLTEKQIQDKIKIIQTDAKWIEDIKKRAEQYDMTFEERLRFEAIAVLEGK